MFPPRAVGFPVRPRETDEDLAEEVVKLLERKGALCISQIVVELCLSSWLVLRLLRMLRTAKRALPQVKTERDKTLGDENLPWILVKK